MSLTPWPSAAQRFKRSCARSSRTTWQHRSCSWPDDRTHISDRQDSRTAVGTDTDPTPSNDRLRLAAVGRPAGWIDDQLELNVVRVAKNEYGGARYRVGRGHRGMDDRGGGQSRRPGIQFRAVGHRERQVVQTDARLIEHLLAAVSMLGQPQPGL